jgi:hypothetical protein
MEFIFNFGFMKKSILGLLLTFTLLCVGSVFANGTDVQKSKTVYEHVQKTDTVSELTVACFENQIYQNDFLISEGVKTQDILNDQNDIKISKYFYFAQKLNANEHILFRPNITAINSLSLIKSDSLNLLKYRRARDGLTKKNSEKN